MNSALKVKFLPGSAGQTPNKAGDIIPDCWSGDFNAVMNVTGSHFVHASVTASQVAHMQDIFSSL